jgi:hypothetical protein
VILQNANIANQENLYQRVTENILIGRSSEAMFALAAAGFAPETLQQNMVISSLLASKMV